MAKGDLAGDGDGLGFATGLWVGPDVQPASSRQADARPSSRFRTAMVPSWFPAEMTRTASPILLLLVLAAACGRGGAGSGPLPGATPGTVVGATFAVGTTRWSYVDTTRPADASSRGGSVVSDRTLVNTIWYPAQGSPGVQAGEDATPAAGVFPVVLFSHELGGTPADYASLLSHWAAFGYVVAAPA